MTAHSGVPSTFRTRVTSEQVWSLVTRNQNCGHGNNWAMMLLCVVIVFQGF